MLRRSLSFGVAVILAVAGCSQSGDTGVDETTTTATASIPTTTLASTTTVDPVRFETDRIIQAWIDGWLADDADAVIALYAEGGIYADAAYPFEYDADYLVRHQMNSATSTLMDPVNVTYTDTGAVADWQIGGRYKRTEFSMNASTTFEIEDGMIVRNTDSYVRCEPPWTPDCES